MIGLVLVTHGKLADEFLSALIHVVGPLTHVEAISIGPEDNMEQRREDIGAAIEAVNTGQGVIITTDMFGGTPSNLSISFLKPGEVEVIAGVNLPMLVKLAKVRDANPITDVIEIAREAGQKYISVPSQVLKSGKST